MNEEFKENDAGDDVQMPLGVGGDAAPAEDYSAPRTRVNTSTLALVAAFAAALVVLYFLGLQNKARSASADDVARAQATNVTIESWIKTRTGQGQVREFGDSLITMLSRYFDRQASFQIEDLTANPFERVEKPVEIALAPPGSGMLAPPPNHPIDPQLLEAAKVFSGLRLQMIMVGKPSSSALINNQMANVGTQFGPLTVTDIQTDRVILAYKEKSFELKSNSPQMSKP